MCIRLKEERYLARVSEINMQSKRAMAVTAGLRGKPKIIWASPSWHVLAVTAGLRGTPKIIWARTRPGSYSRIEGRFAPCRVWPKMIWARSIRHENNVLILLGHYRTNEKGLCMCIRVHKYMMFIWDAYMIVVSVTCSDMKCVHVYYLFICWISSLS